MLTSMDACIVSSRRSCGGKGSGCARRHLSCMAAARERGSPEAERERRGHSPADACPAPRHAAAPRGAPPPPAPTRRSLCPLGTGDGTSGAARESDQNAPKIVVIKSEEILRDKVGEAAAQRQARACAQPVRRPRAEGCLRGPACSEPSRLRRSCPFLPLLPHPHPAAP